MRNLRLLKYTISLVTVSTLVSCRADRPSTGFKPATTIVSPNASQVLNKLDIMWVIDNSGSMSAAQSNLASNFSSFVSIFTSKGYDYKLAVVGSDAYRSNAAFGGGPTFSYFKFVGASPPPGMGAACNGSYTPCTLNTPVVTPLTANYTNTFINNALVGTSGSGDERAFSSFVEGFANASNSGFLRSDSYLAIIILSDEDDFSSYSRPIGGASDNHDYNYATLDPVANYITYLDTLTGTTGIFRRYSVSTITIPDDSCSDTYYGASAHTDAQGGKYKGTRYMSLANSTSGVIGSMCDASYATALSNISSAITVLSTQFTLDYPAQVSTIYVAFDGVQVPQSATNGWTYSSSLQAVQFHGTYTPTQNTNIFIDYLPSY